MEKPVPADSGRHGRNDLLICVSLAAVTVAAFWPALFNDFVKYDDPDFVTANPYVRSGLSWRGIAWAFGSLAVYWEPLTWISYMIDAQLYGLDPRGFHVTNLALHVACTIVLFRVLKRLTGAVWPSAFVAALFALHPLHVETAAWVAERKGVLSTWFFLLAISAYARYAERPAVRSYLMTVLWFALGLMAKPMVITLPAVLLLLDFWPLRRLPGLLAEDGPGPPDRSHGTPRRVWTELRGRLYEKLPLFALAAVSAALAIAAQANARAILSLDYLPVSARLAGALVSYLHYVGKAVWPTGLAVFYPHPQAWPWWEVAIAAIFLAGVSLQAVRHRRRWPYLLTGWLWFLVTLLPVIGIIQVGDQAMADRYTYIPLIGLFISITWGAVDLLAGHPAKKRVLAPLAVAGLAACSVLTHLQTRQWRDTQSLFAHTWKVTRNNYLAATVLGSLMTEAGRFDEAIRWFSHALEIKPDYPDAHLHWGNALERQGKPDAAAAHYTEALRVKPHFVEPHIALGLLRAGQLNYDEAIRHYTVALQYNPASAAARNNLAMALQLQGRISEAIAQYSEALRIDPSLAATHNNLAIALQAKGRWNEALEHYQAVVQLQPDSPKAHINVGGLLFLKQQPDEAVRHYRQALRLSPDDPEALMRLAWILATGPDPKHRDGAEALRLAERACQLTGQQEPLALNALAAAQAETGQFNQAVETIQRAIAQATAAGQKEKIAVLQKILGLYRQGKPYREGMAR